ncbi:MAG: hypothetical protein AAGA92_12085 [Planctomycetota bacterium]
MSTARDAYGTVYNKGTAVLMARVVNASGQNLIRAHVSSISYSVFELSTHGQDPQSPVTGHENVSLNANDCVFDTLQNDGSWSVDSTGYNFRHEIDVSAAEAFTSPGATYLVRYEVTPVQGQRVVFRFMLRCL